ncbi:MBL fold metallo-hydrolase [Saprospira grandis]|uniref:MBL fold metallo-hydrolase n=1 Tax=Saprospira grandis TaxID=1008 RepID=UPI0022DCF2A6|nr:MBL fold metallo-hydrolase [Saprospira grandis]WBM74347.1 MBL fold metallo-hydrolase [Saprospira grandis]
MFFKHIYDKSLAQASYMIACQKAGVAAVIDPKRDVDTYLDIAKQEGFTITHILETHIHADFLAGSRELAELTGAKMYLSAEGGEGWEYEFPHEGLKDGDEFWLGNLKFEVWHTPGHTPESISFLLTDTPATEEPVMLFTGDFVFVGDIGRPDLLEKAAGIKGTQDEGAKQMLASVRRFKELPDFIQLWPGHGAGSACGKALGAVPSSTVGYEKIRNWACQLADDDKAFTDYLLEDQPEPPKYFAKMKLLNRVERPLLTKLAPAQELDWQTVATAMQAGIPLIDARPRTQVEKEGFIPGTLNIQHNNAFSTWAGWFLDYDKDFMLLAAEDQIDELRRKLMRIGLDNFKGFVASTAVYPQALHQPDIIELAEVKALKGEYRIFDIRSAKEYKEGHIEGAEHFFLGKLYELAKDVDRNEAIILHCQGGDRAAIGYSILVQMGFKNIKNFSGGIKAWTAAKEPLV